MRDMKWKRLLPSLVLIAALLLSGCANGGKAPVSPAGADDSTVSASEGRDGTKEEPVTPPDQPAAADPDGGAQPSPEAEGTEAQDAEPEEAEPLPPASEEKYTFEPHLYSPLLSAYYSQEWWDSFYHLCDALREGGDTFECASQEIYDWCMDSVTLANMFPPACMVVSGESSDGTIPFENGVGRIYYGIPPEEYVARQAEFEALIEDILNSVLEPDDTEFEKCFKLYAYMESTFTYGDADYDKEGYTYSAFLHKQGVCEHMSGVYVYLLLQAGVDALNIGCFEGIQHAWTYMIVDGEGYHTDPTWALHGEDEPLSLMYFLTTEEDRNDSGLPTDDLTSGMVPGFWLSRTETVLPASSERFACLRWSYFVSLDEENKILYYEDDTGVHELNYQ